MKNTALLIILFFAGLTAFSQKTILRLARIPGYLTLAGDFHIHTIFSDGEVWPAVRLDEAEKTGLDIIAFTDHIEYQPHKDFVSTDLNAAWKIASEEGRKRDIIVVHGAEITRKMPPGHFNALFINDAGKLTDPDFMKVMEAAIAQGAFIQWNHPGWKGQRPDGIPRMDSIHKVLIGKGWMHGIEIYNYNEFYPDVMNWCLDHNLTMMGNSDIHGPLGTEYAGRENAHRPITLVFAKSRSEKDVKEALMSGRTLVWFGDTLAGKNELASLFFLNSIETGKPYFSEGENTYRYITNKTDIPFHISIIRSEPGKAPLRLSLPANSASRLKLSKDFGNLLHATVDNILIGKGEVLKVDLMLEE